MVELTAQRRLHIVVGHRPDPALPAGQNGTAFSCILAQAMLMVGPSVAEHRNRLAPGGCGPGPDHKVRFAPHRQTQPRTQLALHFDAITLTTHLQNPTGLAMDDVLNELDQRQRALAAQAGQAFDETRLEYGIQVGVDDNVRNGLHPLQLTQRAHQVGQHRLGVIARNPLHVAAQPILVQAAVAAILFRIGVARAIRQRLQRHAQHIGQGTRIVRQQLVEISRASGYGVIQHHERLARPAIPSRFVLLDHAQVVHLAAEATLQPQLQGRHERLHDAFIDPVPGIGHQNTQGFGLELAIEIEAFDHVSRVLAAVFRAIEAMRLFVTFLIAPGWLLHLAAVAAQPKPRARGFPVRHLERFAGFRDLAEVHIPEGHPGDELETKRQSIGGHLPRFPDVRRQKIRHQLTQVILGLPVFRAIVDAYLGIVTVGNRLTKAQQGASLRRVPPHGILAAGADRMHVRLDAEVLHVVATGTESPIFGLGQIHVDLVHLDPPLVGVKAVLRSKLGQRRLRRTLVLQGIERDVAPLSRLIRGSTTPQYRFELYSRLRKSVVGNQSVIGQRAEQVTRVDLLDELQKRISLAQQLINLSLGRLITGLLLELFDGLVEFILALLVAPSFFQQLGQYFDQTGAQSIGLPLALHEVQQPGMHHRISVRIEQMHEGIKQAHLMGQHMIGE